MRHRLTMHSENKIESFIVDNRSLRYYSWFVRNVISEGTIYLYRVYYGME
jgi:hypothetical protein